LSVSASPCAGGLGCAAREVRDPAVGPVHYFSQPGAAAFLLFIVLYKLGDAFAGSLMTPFLLKSMAFSPAEVGVVTRSSACG